MINFGVWAPDEQTFWTSWQNAGICDAERNLLSPYNQCVQLTAGLWPGTVERNGVPVEGWHCNVRVFGLVEDQFTSNIEQYDENGVLRDVIDRTWAVVAFSLTEQPADTETGFPAGWRSSTGVTYTDIRNFSTPANVWQ